MIFIISISYFASTIPGISYIVFENKFDGFYSIPIYRLPEFIIGICCFQLTQTISRKNYDYYIIFIFILLLVYLAKFSPYIYVSHNWIVVPVIGIMLTLLAKSNGFIFRLLSNRIFVYFGKISYCFYSFQILIILTIIQYKVGQGQTSIGFIEVSMIATLLIIISALEYHFIEEPGRHKINHLYTSATVTN